VALRFLFLGAEHVWTGFDHLLFLLGLLLVSERIRDMLLVVTGFTAAHSITLGAAALGWVTLPSALVEAGIAASIVYVGFENLWSPLPRRRLLVTFALGLLHGFGFAGLLTEIGLPRDALVLALVSFNGGVELGQALVALPVLPLLLLLRRKSWWLERGVPVLSLAVAAAGMAWLVERLLAAW
jgi:hydrogenase/urease accessory protein HupE